MVRFSTVLLSTGILAAISCASYAQDLDKEIRKPADSAEADNKTAATAEEASLLKSVEGTAEVTYADILKDPDNIDLSYRYAKKQVKEGDLKGASATLERILSLSPEISKIRLIYAVVLYRLDNLIEARRELKALEPVLTSESMRGEVKEYLKRIESRLKRTNISTTLGMGWHADTNRNASPSSGERLFNGTPVTLTSGLREDDTSAILMAKLGVTHDPGTQAGHTLFTELSSYRAEQDKVDVLDLQAYTLRAGGVLKTRLGEFTPAGDMGQILLAEKTYLRTHGGDIRWDLRVNKTIGLFALAQASHQGYVNTKDIPTATERTGWQTGGSAGANYVLRPAIRLTGSFGYFHKDARKPYNAYNRYELKGSLAWLLGKGCFMLSSLTLHSDSYRAADAAVAPATVRSDTSLRTGVTLGTPLGFIAKPLAPFLWTATYERFRTKSNLTNYTYTNDMAGMMLTYKWNLSL